MTDASPCCSRTVYPPVFGAQTLKVTLVAPEVVVVVVEGGGGDFIFPTRQILESGGAL